MVKGLDLFREHFAPVIDQYVLIGGTAATLAMGAAGLDFRATKDFDIVLHVEALTADFGSTFWSFVERGGYAIRQASESKKPMLYRFQKPEQPGYPVMLELFCRTPDGIRLVEGGRLTPIPFDETVASLSAILLDDDYYRFVLEGRRNVDGLPWIGAEQLIPLKARAWIDLSGRRAAGEKVDAGDVRKHANDVIRLSQLLAPDTRITLATQIAQDMNRFVTELKTDGTYEPKKVQIKTSLVEIIDRIRQAYGLG